LLKRHYTRFLWAHYFRSATRVSIDATELDILSAIFHQSISTLSTALHHATVVPAANTNSANAADNIGDNVEWIKVSTIRKEALNEFRTNPKP
jgi:hypothetical protein